MPGQELAMSSDLSAFRESYVTVKNPNYASGDVYPPRFDDTTWFFRFPQLMDKLADYVLRQPTGSISNLLFAPCSVGCEPITFTMVADKKGVFKKHPDVKIHALDISEGLLKLAAGGAYPYGQYRRPYDEYQEYFSVREEEGMVDISDAIMQRVQFLPAQDIRAHKPARPYDAVVCLNLLYHLDRETGLTVFNSLVSMTKGIICVSDASFMDRDDIARTMKKQKKGFTALTDDFNESRTVHPKSSDYVFGQLLECRTDAGVLAAKIS